MGTIEAETAVTRATDPATLIREHQAGVWRYVRYLGANRTEADDLVQETFLAVLQRPFEDRSRLETAAYLRIAARRRLLMLRRKEGREMQLVFPLDELPLADQVWAEAAGDDGLETYLVALRTCLQSAVTDRVRSALDMQYKEKASRTVIAEKLAMTVEGVKTLLRRAKASLRECVERKVLR